MVMKEKVYTQQMSRNRGLVIRNLQGWQREQNMGNNLYCHFYWKTRSGRVSRFRISAANNFSGLWNIGAVSSCPVPGCRRL